MDRPFPLRVRAPASSANLGPGFDLLALALDLHLEVEARPAKEQRLLRRGTLATLSEVPEDDLLVRGARAVEVATGRTLPPLDLVADSRIPLARGLGSSGAAIAAGLTLANELTGRQLSREDLGALGAGIEGHPENVAASLFGGLVAVPPLDGGRWRWLRPPFHPDLHLGLAWPDLRVPTEEARAALPSSLRFGAAKENSASLLLLLEGLRTLEGDLVRRGVRDAFHVPFRSPRIPQYARVVEAAHRAGALGATISGSGSAVAAFCPSRRIAEVVSRAMAEVFEVSGSGGGAAAVAVDALGAGPR